MQYVKTLSIIILAFFLIVFGVNNTQPYVLSFLDYHLVFAPPLWVLIMTFFFAGMIPLFLASLTERYAHSRRMKEMHQKIDELNRKQRVMDEKIASEESE